MNGDEHSSLSPVNLSKTLVEPTRVNVMNVVYGAHVFWSRRLAEVATRSVGVQMNSCNKQRLETRKHVQLYKIHAALVEWFSVVGLDCLDLTVDLDVATAKLGRCFLDATDLEAGPTEFTFEVIGASATGDHDMKDSFLFRWTSSNEKILWNTTCKHARNREVEQVYWNAADGGHPSNGTSSK